METLHRIQNRKTEIAVLLILVFELCFPHATYAASAQSEPENSLNSLNSAVTAAEQSEDNQPEVQIYRVIKTLKIPITAYSSTVDQCDSTPCITANGFNLCKHDAEDVIAANFLPFGAKVRIPELYGDRIFTVQDRMNARYYYRADIWMKTRAAAIKFGLAYAQIEVIE